MRQVKKKPMACAIGLSRILREDRATKDGYGMRMAIQWALFKADGRLILVDPKYTSQTRPPAFSSREAKKA